MTLDKQAVDRVRRAMLDAGPNSWDQARAAIAALVPQEEEVGRMVADARWLRELAADIPAKDEQALEAHNRLKCIADLLERLVGIQGK